MPGITFADLLARNLRAARAAAHISQADVGHRMNALGFTVWRRQTMGNAERGTRRVTAEELLGLCVALECPLSALMLPVHSGSQEITLPGGQLVGLTRDANAIVLITRRRDGTTAPDAWDGNIPKLASVNGDSS